MRVSSLVLRQCYASTLTFCVALATITSSKGGDNRSKRQFHYSISHPRNSRLERRISNHAPPLFYHKSRPYSQYPPPPPYAVPMEPIAHYSQRDPILETNNHHHHQLHNDLTADTNHLTESVYPSSNYIEKPIYLKEPEPIIEIIIKESNTTLPPLPTQPPPPPRKKEQVQVFYVKYKKNPYGRGKDAIIYDKPIPAISPPVADDPEPEPSKEIAPTSHISEPPPPSTTLRTVIHPESETYHGPSGIKVTFGKEGFDYSKRSPQGRQLHFRQPHTFFQFPSFQQQRFNANPQPEQQQPSQPLRPPTQSYRPFKHINQQNFFHPQPITTHNPIHQTHSNAGTFLVPPPPPPPSRFTSDQPNHRFNARPAQTPTSDGQFRFHQQPAQQHFNRFNSEHNSPPTTSNHQNHPQIQFQQQPPALHEARFNAPPPSPPQALTFPPFQPPHRFPFQQAQFTLPNIEPQQHHYEPPPSVPQSQPPHLAQITPSSILSHDPLISSDAPFSSPFNFQQPAELLHSVPKFEQHISTIEQHAAPPSFDLQRNPSFNHVAYQRHNTQYQSNSDFRPTLRPFLPTTIRTQFATRRHTIPPTTTSTTTSTTTTTTTTTTTPKPDTSSTIDPKILSAQLPDEVPDELREQLLSSGILNNAQISILDYDKIGDIPLSALPPEHLANFYGAGGAQQIGAGSEMREVRVRPEKVAGVEMKVVRYDPSSASGQNIENKYMDDSAEHGSPVVVNDGQYTRYLPLKVSGSQFPIPTDDILKGRSISSVVILAPLTTDFSGQRETRDVRVEDQTLIELLRRPSIKNFARFLDSENRTSSEKQSVILLVVNSTNNNSKDIFMYDVSSNSARLLDGALSSEFVDAAEANSSGEKLKQLSRESTRSNQVYESSDLTDNPGPIYKSKTQELGTLENLENHDYSNTWQQVNYQDQWQPFADAYNIPEKVHDLTAQSVSSQS